MVFTVASAAVQRQQSGEATDLLRDEVSRLVVAVSTWTPARWGAASTNQDGLSRADAAYALALVLTDLGERAGVGGPPGQLPPRLHDLALASQLAVLAAELLGACPAVEFVAQARAAVRVATIALGLT